MHVNEAIFHVKQKKTTIICLKDRVHIAAISKVFLAFITCLAAVSVQVITGLTVRAEIDVGVTITGDVLTRALVACSTCFSAVSAHVIPVGLVGVIAVSGASGTIRTAFFVYTAPASRCWLLSCWSCSWRLCCRSWSYWSSVAALIEFVQLVDIILSERTVSRLSKFIGFAISTDHCLFSVHGEGC